MGGKCSKKKMMRILSLLLAAIIFLDMQGMIVLAETISGNETRAGAESPANPLHHCTKQDDGTDYTDFSYIYFGSYPQSEVTDAATKQAIDSAISLGMGQEAGTTEGSEGTDVWLNGTKYRRISRENTNDQGKRFNEAPTNNGYRYFKWERIKWKVLQNSGSSLFVVADNAIDCKDYNDEDKDITWENSTLRNWLNDSFYNTAFSSSEQGAIVMQSVVNEDNPYHGTEGGNDTRDKIYLLSISEVSKEAYGFCSNNLTDSMSRRMKTSDYAKARGTWTSDNSGYEDNCKWWLRSPGTYMDSAAYVTGSGYVYEAGVFSIAYAQGVCPALHINPLYSVWSTIDDGTSGEGGGDEKAVSPSASISTGSSVEKNTKLALSSATAGAGIYYTTDGTMPTMESTLYTEEITIDHDLSIKAVAMCKGCRPSDVSEFTYKVKRNDNEEETPLNPIHNCTKRNDGTDNTDFSYIFFGSYPQSEVTDKDLTASIDKAVEKYGTESEAGMDVWVNGTKYRRIRKADTNDSGSEPGGMATGNDYRYFKWERIKWKVLQNDGDTLFVAADMAIDSKSYNKKRKNVTWETSTLRDWLNTGFYHTAFVSNEQSAIVEQSVGNEDNPYGTEGGNDTRDKIYLLSISEAIDEICGFCSDVNVHSMSRRVKKSDYANVRAIWDISTEACGRNYEWWLRSPGQLGYAAAYINSDGDVSQTGDYVENTAGGICPALHINLSSSAWSMTDDGTSGEDVREKAANPSASVPTGSNIAKNTKLILSCSTAGADIYYTTDGTMPTMESALYTGEITMDRDMTVKAIAMCRGYRASDVVKFTYRIQTSGSGEEGKKDDGNKKENDNKNGGNQTNNIKIQKLAIKAPSKKLAAGKKVKLTLNVTPKNATNKTVKWKTSNKKYATVNKNGKITLKKKGIGKKVTITATSTDGSGRKASIKIKIMRHAVKSIKLTASKKTLKAGKTMTIKATIKTTGKNANKALKWKSSNKKYATVNKKGKVTAKKAGKGKTVTITATSTDGSNKKAKVRIKIK